MSVFKKARNITEVPKVKSLAESMAQGKTTLHPGPKVGSLAETMHQGGQYVGKNSADQSLGSTMHQGGNKRKAR